MSRLLLTFYGDDFTGSTDALEQLSLAGVRTALFISPPTPKQVAHIKGIQAVGVAGPTRSLAPTAMERELRFAFRQLKALGAPHVHYKVCSTFDSSPGVGSIGRAIDLGARVFQSPFVPVLAAAPALGRYTVFGNHFARYGIGSTGAIHRLDRHPAISRHPTTPMTEADLRLHLAKQTQKRIVLFDILQVAMPESRAREALRLLLAEKPEVVLFDALCIEHLKTIGSLLNGYASPRRPLFSIGSSGVEAALAATLATSRAMPRPRARFPSLPAASLLVGSGSCSPVTGGQIAWALEHGFAEVALDPQAVASVGKAEIDRAAGAAASLLRAHRGVIVHTTKAGPNRRLAARLGSRIASVLGTALGQVLRRVLEQSSVSRLCIAGGDTSSHAARALGIEALEMIAPLTPGAPLCRATAPRSPVHDLEVVIKGGQVGGDDYFELVQKGTR